MNLHPLAPMAAAYVGGVFLAYWQEPLPGWWLAGLWLAVLALAAGLGACAWRSARLPAWGLALLGFLLGAACFGLYGTPAPPADNVADAAMDRKQVLLADVVSAPERTAHGWRMLVQARKLEGKPVSGGVRLSVPAEGKLPAVGSRVAALVSLKPITSFANPGGFDYATYMARQGVYARAYAGKRAGLRVLGDGDVGWLTTRVQSVRARLAVLMEDLPTGQGRALLRALVLGQRGELAIATRDAFAAVGAAHLLAISGLHLGLVWGLAFLLLRWLWALIPGLALRWPAPQPAAVLALIPCLGYALLAGASTPTLRALIMAACLAGALAMARPYRPGGALALAALIIGILWPYAPTTLSFQLSFLAVAAILLAVGPVAKRVQAMSGPRWRGVVLGWLVVSSLVGLAVWPVAVQHFHRLPWLSPLGNALITPVVALLVLPPALLGAGLALVWPAGGMALMWPAWLLATAGVGMAQGLAALPGADWFLAGPGPLAAGLMLAAVLGAAALPGWRPWAWPRWVAGAGLGLAALTVWAMQAPPPPTGGLTAWVLDVGQGSSAAVRLPGGQVVVVDGGGWPASDFDFGRNVVGPFLWHLGFTELEAVAASHAHPDHTGGLAFLARWFDPRQVWVNDPDPAPGSDGAQGPYARLLAQARAMGAPVLGPEGLARMVELDGGRLICLWPRPGEEPPKGENHRSLWLGLGLGGDWLWLPGDNGPAVEKRVAKLLPAEVEAGRSVLAAPHHGGKGALTRELISRLKPRAIVFSAGCGNRYHLPSAGALSRAKASGAEIFSTARQGAIRLDTQGQGWGITPWLEQPRRCPSRHR